MKSHVSMEQKMCLVCGRPYNTNAILLDMRLKKSLDSSTLTGPGLCPDDQARFDNGYIALVGCDEAKSDILPNGNISPSGAWRTGEIAHIRFEVFDRLFNVPRGNHSVIFCDSAVIAMLNKLADEK